jgi:hypothetical protein
MYKKLKILSQFKNIKLKKKILSKLKTKKEWEKKDKTLLMVQK